MLIFKIPVFIAFVVITLIVLMKNTNRWSKRFQKHAISQMMQVFGDSEGWDDPWALLLSKAIVVFFGLMFIVVVYAAVFSADTSSGNLVATSTGAGHYVSQH